MRILKINEIPVLEEHGNYIGIILDLYEDSVGIYANILLFDDEFLNKSTFFFSIGYKVLQSYKKDNIRYIEAIELKEVSIVQNPVQNNTKVTLQK